MKIKHKVILPAVIFMVSLTGFGILNGVLPDHSNTWFSTSGKCVLCHNQSATAMRDVAGNDVSPVSLWRSAMIANSSKDPFWLAKVRHEGLENPRHQEELENVCTRCHAPMGMVDALMTGGSLYTLATLTSDPIGRDGISCTVCHQIDDVGSPGFSGQFGINRTKEAYGPYLSPLINPMMVNSGYKPVYSSGINDARLCGVCHTLLTNSVDDKGELTGETFVEQALYHEWQNSVYARDTITCQACHMPRIDESIKISSLPPFIAGRQPFGRHDFTGGNLFMLNLLKQNHADLGLVSGAAFLDQTIERTRIMLTEKTMRLSIDDTFVSMDSVTIRVTLENLAGHKFPTGFPSRRAYLEFMAISGNDTVFHSGRPGSGALNRKNEDGYEPHHEVIRDDSRVQIYEFVMGDTRNGVTTVLEKAYKPLKDNRIPPIGFSSRHLVYDTVRIVGLAESDIDYQNGSGRETVTYRLPLSILGSNSIISVLLHYETVPESWVQELFEESDNAFEIRRFKSMYEASTDRRVTVAAATKSLQIASVSPDETQPIGVYPNPSSGTIWISGATPGTRYSIHNQNGVCMLTGNIGSGTQRIHLNIPSGVYYVVFLANGVRRVEKILELSTL
ncbi:MAG: T9SS type A sorting domain-containing protein [Bacteroidales bacterium]